VRWRCNIDGVDLRIVDQLIGIVIPARNTVSSSVVGGKLAISTHDGNEFRSLSLLKTGSALAFSDIPNADNPPPHPLHGRQRRRTGSAETMATSPSAAVSAPSRIVSPPRRSLSRNVSGRGRDASGSHSGMAAAGPRTRLATTPPASPPPEG